MHTILFGIRQNTCQQTTTWLASHSSSKCVGVCFDTSVSNCACVVALASFGEAFLLRVDG